jgi:hypothetical protein
MLIQQFLMGEILPDDDERLKNWCSHQIRHVPALGEKLGLSAAEVSVFVENCKALIEALDGRFRGALFANSARAPQKIVPRIKKTSLRRQIQSAKIRMSYDPRLGIILGWG